MKKISIVMPVFNKEYYVEKTIKSIMEQSFEDFELLIVDDGSTDQSGIICDEWGRKDNRIKVFHIENGGVSNARNVAIRYVNTPYVTFVDADDYVGKDYLKYLYNSMSENHVDMVISGCTKIWRNSAKKITINTPIVGKYRFDYILPNFAQWQNESGIFGYCVGKLVRAELLKGIEFDKSLELAEDFDFYLKVYRKMESVYFDEHAEYYYTQEADNSSSIKKDNEIDYLAQLKINLRYRDFLIEKKYYTEKNKVIVEKKISNYFYFTLFYCDIKKFDECFEHLYKLYCECQVTLSSDRAFSNCLLSLLMKNKKMYVKNVLLFYRWMRKQVRGK